MKRNNSKKWLSVRDFAEEFAVHVDVARRWIYQGKVNFTRTPGGEYRIPFSEVTRFTQLCGGPDAKGGVK
ncbi:MAG: excisionase family DNA-binding protein [Chthoniobacterales bacterium]